VPKRTNRSKCYSQGRKLAYTRVVHGLGWVGLGRDFSAFCGLGCVGCTIAEVLKFERIMLMHLEHGQISFGCTKQLNLLVALCWVGLGLFPLVVGWAGLDQSADGLGWIESHKMDPWTTQGNLCQMVI